MQLGEEGVKEALDRGRSSRLGLTIMMGRGRGLLIEVMIKGKLSPRQSRSGELGDHSLGEGKRTKLLDDVTHELLHEPSAGTLEVPQ